MQGHLSFENAPPFSVPLRFFLTASLFGVLAGGLMLVAGEAALTSRWSPVTLALTHLITLGVMLTTMLGALFQIMPVAIGAELPAPRRLAALTHLGVSLGTAALVSGLLLQHAGAMQVGAGLLTVGIAGFLRVAAGALRGLAATNATVRCVGLALLALAVTVGLGVTMASGLAQGWALPFTSLTDLHVAWGLAGWGGLLLAGIAYIVVPMFQLTPPYPLKASLVYPWLVIGLLLLWSGWLAIGGSEGTGFAAGLALAGGGFAALTLHLQARRRRARPDPTYRYWQLGLAGSLLAGAMVILGGILPEVAAQPAWAVSFGVVALGGAFVPLILGMLYKIVPFLAWMHLQNSGLGLMAVPPMNRLLPESAMLRQLAVYGVALGLALLAPWGGDLLARAAGLMTALAFGGLGWNLLTVVHRFRRHRQPAAMPEGR